jgi:transposase-like protein
VGKVKRKFDIEFKKQIVSEVDSGQMTLTAAAKQYQLSPGLIVKWRRQLREGDLVAGPSGREKVLEAELAKYRELCGKQAFELDWLKKTFEYFKRSKSENSSVVTSANWEASKPGVKC